MKTNKLKPLFLASALAFAGALAIGGPAATAQNIYISTYRTTDLQVGNGSDGHNPIQGITYGLGDFTNPDPASDSVSGISAWGLLGSADASLTHFSTITQSSPTDVQVSGSMHESVNWFGAAFDDQGHYGGASATAENVVYVQFDTDAPFVFTLSATTSHSGSFNGSIYNSDGYASYVALFDPAHNPIAEFGEESLNYVNVFGQQVHSALSDFGGYSDTLPAGTYFLYAIVQDAGGGNGSGGSAATGSGDRSASFSLTVSTAPEPSTWATILGGIASLVGLRRFRRGSA